LSLSLINSFVYIFLELQKVNKQLTAVTPNTHVATGFKVVSRQGMWDDHHQKQKTKKKLNNLFTYNQLNKLINYN
jgi:hypothetical protein